MERRWSPRTLVNLDVDLMSGKTSYEGRTKDVGLGGVFVEIDGKIPALESQLDIVFKLELEDRETKHRIKAKVVRVSNVEGGVGLMFRSPDASTFRALQDILRSAQAVVA